MVPRLLYIAGAYRAPTAWLVEQNIRRAEEAAMEVLKLGAYPICPHTNTRGWFDKVQPDEFMLEATLELMRRCDGVLMMLGWSKSSGASAEYDEARRLRLPVFFELRDLEEALKLAWRFRPPIDSVGGASMAGVASR